MPTHADMAGRSPLRTVALAAGTEIHASTTSLRARHVVAAAATPVAAPALHARGQVASSWTQPLFPGRDEDSHDSGALPASRQPRADRPPPPYLRRSTQPARRRLAVALRNCPRRGTVCRACRGNQLIRRCTDGPRDGRHSLDNLVLGARPAVRDPPRLVPHHAAPRTRRMRRRTYLLQPRQDSYH